MDFLGKQGQGQHHRGIQIGVNKYKSNTNTKCSVLNLIKCSITKKGNG